MEFVCVMSIKGGLVSYVVERENDETFRARLNNPHAAAVVAPEVKLEKRNGTWHLDPQDDEVLHNLVKCIEGRP